ncbi:MAG: hypothetical protein GY830_10785 [Bacteroidetes bacterium]|nr:hypothetical protein [Bacteroidota bacterium]
MKYLLLTIGIFFFCNCSNNISKEKTMISYSNYKLGFSKKSSLYKIFLGGLLMNDFVKSQPFTVHDIPCEGEINSINAHYNKNCSNNTACISYSSFEIESGRRRLLNGDIEISTTCKNNKLSCDAGTAINCYVGNKCEETEGSEGISGSPVNCVTHPNYLCFGFCVSDIGSIKFHNAYTVSDNRFCIIANDDSIHELFVTFVDRDSSSGLITYKGQTNQYISSFSSNFLVSYHQLVSDNNFFVAAGIDGSTDLFLLIQGVTDISNPIILKCPGFSVPSLSPNNAFDSFFIFSSTIDDYILLALTPFSKTGDFIKWELNLIFFNLISKSVSIQTYVTFRCDDNKNNLSCDDYPIKISYGSFNRNSNILSVALFFDNTHEIQHIYCLKFG